MIASSVAKSVARPVASSIASGGSSTIDGVPSTDLLGLYFASEYDATRKAIPNKLIGGTIPPVYTRNPRGMFATSAYLTGGWLGGGFGGCTTTNKYAAGMDGQAGFGTRVVFASGTSGLRYGAFTLPAGTYTMVSTVKSNTGSSQTFRTSRDGLTTFQEDTATTSWQQFKYEFTIGSSTSVDLRFVFPPSGNGDFVVDYCLLWSGNSASVPATISLGGHLYLANTEAASISCTGGQLALTNAQQATLDFDSVATSSEVTILACVKRTGSYLTAGLGRQPFLYTPMEGDHSLSSGVGLGEIDAEGYLRGKGVLPYGSALTPTGCSPDLFTEGSYHVIAMRSKSDAASVFVDGFENSMVITAGIGSALNWWKMVVGGNVGLGRHTVNSLAVYDRYLTGAEIQTATLALKAKAEASSLTVNAPTNYLICEGDSITAGPSSNSYAQQFIANSTGTGFCLYNIPALGGSMMSLNGVAQLNLSVRLPYHLDGIPDDLTGKRAIFSVMLGANDLQSYTVSAYLAELYSYTDQMRAKGVKVVICTPLPQGSGFTNSAAFNVKQAAMATQLRLDAGTEFDALVDFDTAGFNPETTGSGGDTSDGLHPTAAVHASKLEPVFRAVINSLMI